MALLIRSCRPADPDAVKLITAYMSDIVERWHGRPAENNEVARALDEEPATDLDAPNGRLTIAYDGGEPVGLGGMRFIDHGIAELTKMFTLPHARGRGVGLRCGYTSACVSPPRTSTPPIIRRSESGSTGMPAG